MARFQRTTRPSRSRTRIPESMLSRMFSLYSVSSCSSSAFSRRLVVEPAVHERGGGLAGQRLQEVDLLAVQRVEAVLAAHAEDRDRARPSRGRGSSARGPAAPASGQRLGARLGVDGLARGQAPAPAAPSGGQARAARRPARSRRDRKIAKRAVVVGQEHGQGAHARARRPRRRAAAPPCAPRSRSAFRSCDRRSSARREL